MENKFYVYEHVRKDNGEVFYVGKGTGRRAKSTRRNPYWQNIAAKHGFEVRFVKTEMTEEQAFALEVKTISKHKANGVKLANMTDGGDGVNGLSEASRMKMSIARKLRVTKEETRKKMSECRTGAKHFRAKKVVCVETGRVFEAISLAINWLKENGKPKASNINICNACKKNTMSYGYHWQYA